jgi:transcriptional regulator with XRE-family HTH domain
MNTQDIGCQWNKYNILYQVYKENLMENLSSTIGIKIRELRRGKDLSQEQLAKLMGTTPNTICRWEKGAYKPSIDDLTKLAEYFAVPIIDFFPQPCPSEKTSALLGAVRGLQDPEIDTLIRFAYFCRATSSAPGK